MSEEKPVEIAGAICAAPAPAVEQPRQPTSLQGLLKFAMEATKSEDAPRESEFKPLDEAKKKFLENAIQSLTIDVVEVILKQIKILEKVDSINEDQDTAEYVAALDLIADYICDIDTANDFHKIGGFAIVLPCLKCRDSKIRAQVCNLLAELCQNNGYCQRMIADSDIFPLLMKIIEEDPEELVIVKAVYAVSCIVRQNSIAFGVFISFGGTHVLKNALARNNVKIITKICFFLHALCATENDFSSRLVFHGYIPTLFSLISATNKSSDEYVLELIHRLVENNPTAITECRQNKLNAKEVLENYLSVVKNKEEYAKEEELSKNLWNILFAQK